MATTDEPTDEPVSPAQGYGLDPEWAPGPDGIPYRRAARVVVLDPDGRVLLVRGHDRADATYFWWFTVGGGIAPGEDARAGACRELREETGLVAAPGDLEGPVLHRESLFKFSEVTCRQDEEFFVLRLDSVDDAAGLDGRAGWTDLERDVLDELRWWHPDELRALAARGTLVFPAALPDLVEGWARGVDPSAPVPRIAELDE